MTFTIIVNGTYVNLQNKRGFSKIIEEYKGIMQRVLIVETAILRSDYANTQMVKVAEGMHKVLKEAALNIAKYNPYPNNGIWWSSFQDAIGWCRELDKILDNSEKLIRESKEEDRHRKEKEQRERNEAYWTEHAEEKLQLESERSNLENELNQLKTQANPFDKEIATLKNERDGEVPSEKEKETILSEISRLRKEQGQLGLFKGKEKRQCKSRSMS